MKINLEPIAFVRNSKTEPVDDDRSAIVSHIELAENLPDEVFADMIRFSHLEIIYYLNPASTVTKEFLGTPKSNNANPSGGIFGHLKVIKPNRIGTATVELLAHRGRTIMVKFLNENDGTPVLDIKPVFQKFRAKSKIRQPAWAANFMQNYWRF